MAEINDLNTTDASNTARFPENQAPGTVNNGARALEGMLARGLQATIDGVTTTGGTNTAYTLADPRTLSAYYTGLSHMVKWNATCGATPTINVDSLGAKSLYWPDGTQVTTGDLVANSFSFIMYDGTNYQVLSVMAPSEVSTGVKIATDPAYGATGDGVTDDTTALQAWLDDLAAGTTPVVPQRGYLPAGVYLISSTLTVPTGSNIQIFGAGGGSEGLSTRQGTSKILWDGTAGPDTMLQWGDLSTNIRGCTLRDIMIDSDNTASITGIEWENCDDMLVERCHISAPTGVDIGTSSNSCTFRSCEFYRCNTYGIYAPASDHGLQVLDCVFRNVDGDPAATCIDVGVSAYASQVRLEGNKVDQHEMAYFLYAQHVNGLTVIGNYIESKDAGTTAALRLGNGATTDVLGAIIAGNHILTASGAPSATAIHLSGGEAANIFGNDFYNWATQDINVDTSNWTGILYGVNFTDGAIANDYTEFDMIVRNSAGIYVGKVTGNNNVVGCEVQPNGLIRAIRSGSNAIDVGRQTSDGDLIKFFRDGSEVGDITVSSGTVSLTAGHISRKAMLNEPRHEILPGTVMQSIDRLIEWSEVEWNDDQGTHRSIRSLERPDKTGYTRRVNPVRHLPYVKVSDTPGSATVSGVFVTWRDEHDSGYDDFIVAENGDFIVRVRGRVALGDLLESAGDGTARVQADEVVRSSTVAKVIATQPIDTYADGSYTVSCLLMMG